MKYYKIILDTTFIGVAHSGHFVRENSKGRLFYADESRGQFIDFKGQLYRDYWMPPVNTNLDYITATITEITEEEYQTLVEAIENDEPIIIDDGDDDNPPEDEPIIINPDVTVEFVREAKIKQMSNVCRQTIEAGVDLEMYGAIKHFSLTTQDQLNLMSLQTLAQTSDIVPYHADGEDIIFYSADDINKIIEAANALRIYETTYFNNLKSYINTLQTIEEISSITYGTHIPYEYQTDAFKALGGK